MFIPKSQNQQCSKRKESANILIYKNPENMADTTSRAPEAVFPWAAEEEQLLVQVPLWHLWNVFGTISLFFQKSSGEKITYLVSFLRSSSGMAHTVATSLESIWLATSSVEQLSTTWELQFKQKVSGCKLPPPVHPAACPSFYQGVARFSAALLLLWLPWTLDTHTDASYWTGQWTPPDSAQSRDRLDYLSLKKQLG